MTKVPSDYRKLLRPNHPHYQLISWITTGSRVADIGCGFGDLSACLQHYKSCKVLAVEHSPDRAQAARAKQVSVYTGSIEANDTWEWLGKDYDAIIFADVLEHLVDPESVLVESKRHLSNGGKVLVSLPNIAHFSIRMRLGVGRFDYNQSGGLLDGTHLRFFTVTTARRLFERSGFSISKCYYRYHFLHNELLEERFHRAASMLAYARPNLFAYQTQFCLTPVQTP